MLHIKVKLKNLLPWKITINPLLSPPGGGAYLFQGHLRGWGGDLIEMGGLFERGAYLI